MSNGTYFKQEADRMFPRGCMCGNNGGADCDWCLVYYANMDCDHSDCDDHCCLDCGKDMTESRMAQAEAMAEGDR